MGKSILLELVAAELDPESELEKATINAYAHWKRSEENEVIYEASFVIPEEFGSIGAILIENEYHEEMFVKQVVIEGFPAGEDPVNFTCNSWVHSKFDNPEKRIFFTNKSYLPSRTPSGLIKYRNQQLVLLRGNGLEERKSNERIYDYDVYNDLGNPDTSDDAARPILGGKEHPYPRRCRTGRPKCQKDPLSESRSSNFYKPRDEAFSDIKSSTFSAKTVSSVLHALIPSIESTLTDKELGFPYFTAIDSLYNEGVYLPSLKSKGFLKGILPRLIRGITHGGDDILRFETPELVDRDKFSWFRDEEFGRQTLAGLNPCHIQLVKEWPLKSKHDDELYGSQESLITEDLILESIGGLTNLKEALQEKKLFMLDYHDLLLPFVNEVRKLKGTTLYGSRTLFHLTPKGTLRPLAIELTRPQVDDKPQWNQVFTPCWDATNMWLWRFAKAHVIAHDSGYHQLVSHW